MEVEEGSVGEERRSRAIESSVEVEERRSRAIESSVEVEECSVGVKERSEGY